MSKAVAIFVGGITELRQVAVREDGVAFSRVQIRGRYGYVWSKWSKLQSKVSLDAVDVQHGFATLHRATPNSSCINDRVHFDKYGRIRYRLP